MFFLSLGTVHMQRKMRENNLAHHGQWQDRVHERCQTPGLDHSVIGPFPDRPPCGFRGVAGDTLLLHERGGQRRELGFGSDEDAGNDSDTACGGIHGQDNLCAARL